MAIRKARTRFTYLECINNVLKGQFVGRSPHLSTRASKGQFWVKMRILLVFQPFLGIICIETRIAYRVLRKQEYSISKLANTKE